jgi:hypothetical protein
VTDAHEAIGEHVEEKTADEFFGIEGHRFQPVFVSLRAKSGLDPLFLSGTTAIVARCHNLIRFCRQPPNRQPHSRRPPTREMTR